MPIDLVAAIDVGSHAMRMKIGELRSNGEFRELESFVKIAALGHDTFTYGKVSFETVDKACSILKAFKNTMTDYDVDIYKAVATSAIREASNNDYIIDQIKLKTGLDIEVIGNSEEQYLTHKAVKSKLQDYQEIISEGAVIVVIGAGSIQITTYKNGELTSSQNVKMGALRTKEILSSLEDETLKYHKILDEYITANLDGLDFFAKDITYKHFIAVSGEIDIIKQIIVMEDGLDELRESIPKKRFNKLLKALYNKSTEDIQKEYNIQKDRAGIILPSMMLFEKFLEITTSDEVITPNTILTDGIIRNIYEDINKLNKKGKTNQDIITNAKVIASKFYYHEAHCNVVEKYSIVLFDKLTKLHGLGKERILLRIAAILHDCGKYISLDMHQRHSYGIIRSLEVYGLSKEQMELIANIARYHSFEIPSMKDNGFRLLSEKNRVLVAKLVAIIRLADAIDRSHQQKIEIQSVKLKNKELIIKATSNKNTKLEEWTFKKKSEFFQEVFGITPVLRIKKDI